MTAVDGLAALVAAAAAAIENDDNCAAWATPTRARDAATAAIAALVPTHDHAQAMLGAVYGYELGLAETNRS